MKKIFLASLLSILGIAMVGCGTSEKTKSLNQLTNYVSDVESVVDSTSSTEINSVSPIAINKYASSRLQEDKNKSYTNMLREEEMRQDVLKMCNFVKSSIKNTSALTNGQAAAIKNLNVSLKRNSANLTNTKNAVKKAVNKLNKYKTGQIDEAESSYVELDNLMQERALYLSNLQATLENVCEILGNSCCDVQSNSTVQNTDENKSSNTIKNNIDSYNTTVEKNNSNEAQQTGNEYYYTNPYNNKNNYYYANNRRFNPNRNTDTFYPRVRNIDTYRFNPYGNGYYGQSYYGNVPPTAPVTYFYFERKPIEEKNEKSQVDNISQKSDIVKDKFVPNTKLKAETTEKQIVEKLNTKTGL